MSEPTLPLTISYRPSTAEQIEAAKAYRRTTRKFLLYRIISILALLATAWAVATPGAQRLAIVWVILAAFTWFDPLPLLLVRLSSIGSNKAAPYSAQFDEQGVVFDIAGQQVKRGWERYQKLIEAPNSFVLVYGGWNYSIIPRRAVGDTAAQEQIRTLFRRKIQAATKG